MPTCSREPGGSAIGAEPAKIQERAELSPPGSRRTRGSAGSARVGDVSRIPQFWMLELGPVNATSRARSAGEDSSRRERFPTWRNRPRPSASAAEDRGPRRGGREAPRASPERRSDRWRHHATAAGSSRMMGDSIPGPKRRVVWSGGLELLPFQDVALIAPAFERSGDAHRLRAFADDAHDRQFGVDEDEKTNFFTRLPGLDLDTTAAQGERLAEGDVGCEGTRIEMDADAPELEKATGLAPRIGP